MIEIFAVRPTGLSAVIHLFSPGYQPGKKARRPPDVGMCNGTGAVRQRDLVPLAEALQWAEPHQPCEHCDAHRPDWHWCHVCLGHGIAAAGLAETAIRDVARHASEPDP